MQNKGTKKAVEDCIRVLLQSQNISKEFNVEDVLDANKKKTYELDIYIPYELKDIALLEDMLDYILPTGYIYNIVTISGSGLGGVTTDVAGMEDELDIHRYNTDDLGSVLPGIISNADTYKTELTMVHTKDINTEE